ncbi:kinase-like protein, partial [Mycena vitilis]
MRKEIDIWLTLRHPNIIQFLGANTLDDTPFLVMPYMPYNARQFLRERPDFDPIHVLCDISSGLQYLHSRRICHGDIKGINILVDDSGRAVLCDFGLARIKSEITNSSIQMGHVVAGSRNWMAPELLVGSSPKMPSDIYAFGMTIYELYTDEIPLSSIPHTDFHEIDFKQQIRPLRPDIEDTPRLNDEIWALAKDCWLHDPKARPLAGTILRMVATMKKE